jgi:hypothetical protein
MPYDRDSMNDKCLRYTRDDKIQLS